MRKLGRWARERRADEAAARLAAGLASFGLGVPIEAIMSASRETREAAFARKIAIYLCSTAFSMSYARIALAFARDRSTVGAACRIVEDKRDDPLFDGWIGAMEDALRQAPPCGTIAPPHFEAAQ